MFDVVIRLVFSNEQKSPRHLFLLFKEIVMSFIKGNIPWMKGRTVSLEAKAKISATHLGHPLSVQHRAKLSVANRGRSLSMEHRAKLSAVKMGDKHPNWKGGIAKTSDGYEKIRIHKCFYLRMHHLMMERILGRKLQTGETVHHINGIKTDNREANLALCSNAAAHNWCRSQEARVFFG